MLQCLVVCQVFGNILWNKIYLFNNCVTYNTKSDILAIHRQPGQFLFPPNWSLREEGLDRVLIKLCNMALAILRKGNIAGIYFWILLEVEAVTVFQHISNLFHLERSTQPVPEILGCDRTDCQSILTWLLRSWNDISTSANCWQSELLG